MEDVDPHQRQAPWPPRLKVKVISSHRHRCLFVIRETKWCTCVIRGRRGHTVSAEPGGHTSCLQSISCDESKTSLLSGDRIAQTTAAEATWARSWVTIAIHQHLVAQFIQFTLCNTSVEGFVEWKTATVQALIRTDQTDSISTLVILTLSIALTGAPTLTINNVLLLEYIAAKYIPVYSRTIKLTRRLISH